MHVQKRFKIDFFKKGPTEYLFFGGNPLNHTPPSQNHGPWPLAKTLTLAAREQQGEWSIKSQKMQKKHKKTAF